MDIESAYPAISDLRARAKRRLPKFVWDFLDSGTGREMTVKRNRDQLDAILLRPSILHGEFEPDLTTDFLGRRYPLPVGIAPVGMSGLIWPGAENTLAQTAAQHGIPYCLSTVASRTPEEVANDIGEMGWFQLYPPRDPDIRKDILNRAKTAGFHSLILTVDVPVASRRERQCRSGLTVPPRVTPRLLAQIAMRPAWAMGTLRHGKPRLRLMESYHPPTKARSSTDHIGYLLRSSPNWEYLSRLRDEWAGPLIVKGVLYPQDAVKIQKLGADAIWVSNHAGRQFDAAPSTIETLPKIRAALGKKFPLVFDGGVDSGLDVIRALALGADFVMLGRAFHYGLGAFGAKGAGHVVNILRKDMLANMGQIGAKSLADLPNTID